jgi:predicted AAA+ superfamily ATPase
MADMSGSAIYGGQPSGFFTFNILLRSSVPSKNWPVSRNLDEGWQELIEAAWREKNIIWLMGVRGVGKTTLCQSLADTEYFDCERPRVRQLLEDPEGFLETHQNKRIILDEIHRLDNPSEILKLAADHYPTVKIIATGSSTLGASSKFKDTLTGRKRELWLTPMLLEEMQNFGNSDLRHRLLFGGCPPFFIKNHLPENDFKEWIDAYWAKDIQELFKVGKRYSLLWYGNAFIC